MNPTSVKMLKKHRKTPVFTNENTRLTNHLSLLPRVSVQNVPVYAGTTRTCVSTCARSACTHGDVLDGHTPHTTYHTPPQDTTQHNMTHHETPQQHDHNTTRRQRQTEKERDREDEKKTRQERRCILVGQQFCDFCEIVTAVTVFNLIF